MSGVGVLGYGEVVPVNTFQPVGDILAGLIPSAFQCAVKVEPKKRKAQLQLQIEVKTAITKIEKSFSDRGVSLVEQFKAGAILPKLVDALVSKRERLLQKSLGYPLKVGLIDREIKGISDQLDPCHDRLTRVLAKLKSDGTLSNPYKAQSMQPKLAA